MEIKQRALESRDLTLRNLEIERLKQEITNNVMQKILLSMTPSLKKNPIKKPQAQAQAQDLGVGIRLSAFDDEEKDVIEEDDIKLNKKLQLKKSVTERGFIKKNFNSASAAARISKGDLSYIKISKEENGN